MSAVTCPHCDSPLPPQEIAEGWCETCGKRIPSHVLSGASGTARGIAGLPTEREGRFSYAAAGQRSLASRMSRLGAAILDGIFTLVLYLPGYVMVVSQGKRGDDSLLMLGALLLLLGIAVVLVVQITLLTMSGQTVGKKLVGVRIVRVEDGTNPGFVGAFLLRSFVPGLIGAIPCIGTIFALVDVLFIFSEDRRCVHDHIAGTKVVKA